MHARGCCGKRPRAAVGDWEVGGKMDMMWWDAVAGE
tara:strand:+ start:433 stop:540 length:108 start_codon:yes stop_codon:yes gene_type:complete